MEFPSICQVGNIEVLLDICFLTEMPPRLYENELSTKHATFPKFSRLFATKIRQIAANTATDSCKLGGRQIEPE
jgi:hypothetical protein